MTNLRSFFTNPIKQMEVGQQIDNLVRVYDSRGFSGVKERFDELREQIDEPRAATLYWAHFAAVAKVVGAEEHERFERLALKSDTSRVNDYSIDDYLNA